MGSACSGSQAQNVHEPTTIGPNSNKENQVYFREEEHQTLLFTNYCRDFELGRFFAINRFAESKSSSLEADNLKKAKEWRAKIQLGSLQSKDKQFCKLFTKKNQTYINSIYQQGLFCYIHLKEDQFQQQMEKGPPNQFRWACWQLLMHHETIFEPQLYDELVKRDSPHQHTIEKDINRTFPQHVYYKRLSSPVKGDNDGPMGQGTLRGNSQGQEQLFRVLKAISLYFPAIGYTQGMNMLVGFILLVSGGNELETFWFFINLSRNHDFLVIGLLQETFPLMEIYLWIFQKLLERELPQLQLHYQKEGFTDVMHIWKWFITLFIYSFPLQFVMRLWDLVFASKTLFTMIGLSVSILSILEEQLLKMDLNELNEFFQQIKEKQETILDPQSQIFLNIKDIHQKSRSLKITKKFIAQQTREYLAFKSKQVVDPKDTQKKVQIPNQYTNYYAIFNQIDKTAMENFEKEIQLQISPPNATNYIRIQHTQEQLKHQNDSKNNNKPFQPNPPVSSKLEENNLTFFVASGAGKKSNEENQKQAKDEIKGNLNNKAQNQSECSDTERQFREIENEIPDNKSIKKQNTNQKLETFQNNNQHQENRTSKIPAFEDSQDELKTIIDEDDKQHGIRHRGSDKEYEYPNSHKMETVQQEEQQQTSVEQIQQISEQNAIVDEVNREIIQKKSETQSSKNDSSFLFPVPPVYSNSAAAIGKSTIEQQEDFEKKKKKSLSHQNSSEENDQASNVSITLNAAAADAAAAVENNSFKNNRQIAKDNSTILNNQAQSEGDTGGGKGHDYRNKQTNQPSVIIYRFSEENQMPFPFNRENQTDQEIRIKNVSLAQGNLPVLQHEQEDRDSKSSDIKWKSLNNIIMADQKDEIKEISSTVQIGAVKNSNLPLERKDGPQLPSPPARPAPPSNYLTTHLDNAQAIRDPNSSQQKIRIDYERSNVSLRTETKGAEGDFDEGEESSRQHQMDQFRIEKTIKPLQMSSRCSQALPNQSGIEQFDSQKGNILFPENGQLTSPKTLQMSFDQDNVQDENNSYVKRSQ